MSTLNAYRRPLSPFARLGAAVLCLSLFLVSLLVFPGATLEVQAQDSECTPSDCVTNVTVEPTSRTPAARTGYEVKFVTPKALAPHTDGIVMVLHEDIGVPPAIAPPLVRINVMGDEARRGIASAVEMNNQDDPRRPTTLTIYPVIAGATEGATPQPIPVNATVTVTFNKNAGISNPTEGGAYSWTVATSQDPTPVPAQHPDPDVRDAFRRVELDARHTGKELNGLLVDWEIQLSHEVAHRGEEVTAIGRGYKNGTTLTFWRDANFDGIRDPNEGTLCQVLVEDNDIGFCTFTVSKPLFARVYGDCNIANSGTSESHVWVASANADCNFINAADGQNHTSILEINEEVVEEGSVAHLSQALKLEGELVAEVGPSRRLTVQMRDFPDGEIEKLELGGVPIDLGKLPSTTVPESGGLYFTVDLPGATRRGYQSLLVVVHHVDAAGHDDLHEVSTIIWVEPNAIVSVFPESVVANQRISLKGQGFIVSEGPDEIARINFNGHVIDFSRVNGGDGPAPIDSNGNWFGYVDLPINQATTRPGTSKLEITDNHGRGGTVEVTVPPREVTVSPLWGRPGASVKVTGKGFPGRNGNGSSVNLQILYESSAGYAVTSAETDTSGNFSGEIRVPLRTPSPSSNFVKVVFPDDDGIQVTTIARHEVPGATVRLTPGAGPPGTPIKLIGTGFRQFANVNSATIGSIDVTPGRSVITDANGDFSFTFLVPGIGTGRQVIEVSVAGVTASSTLDISLSGVALGTPTPVAEAVKNLGDNFVRSFHFDNDAKSWRFYDPSLAEHSDQRFMVAGETYLVLVRENMEVILNGRTRQLTCYQGNCWNQIVW